MTRATGIVVCLLFAALASAQGDQQVRSKADGLFEEKDYVHALPLYSQLVSLTPSDRVLNYRFGTCLLFGGDDKDKAIGHLKFAVQDPSIPADAWYWLGRAYHLNYQFKDAQAAYQRYQGTGSKKELEGFSVAALDKQCRNGQQLLSNLKEITVRNKVEVDETEFFRFYELADIGGKIVVLPEELKSNLDKKSKERTLVYLPDKGGAFFFASYGKDGKTGRDIYRTELMPDGTFATPIKLAGYVNTDQDEDFAFLHPDGKSFYFSSKGHNSMGGYDVFRSAFDRGLDTFGPPENLDFAVNTPDDDLFYMTDAENKEACFASGRDSEQGKLHVYRVGTAQVPLVITVLKGTFASAFDPNDRKAHIKVEDAVTRERVADVRTDQNGLYVLALPRSGQFRYLVECGPSGRTHVGIVDVPRSSSPRAYRQELELTKQGDLEKLAIRNYFDTPLEEDMLALMMEEIKRRAKLDITSETPVVASSEPEPSIASDPLTQAGFAGDVTEAQAVSMAKKDAAEQELLMKELEEQSEQAFGIAVGSVADAERMAREAEALVNAASAMTDEEARSAKMVEAASLRQRSREANLRARAAYRTGQDMTTERLATQQRAAAASKLAMDLENAVTAKKPNETVTHLKTLKQRLDTKAGPDGDLTMAERARRTLSEQEKEAARNLTMANSKRTEENEFMDRIARSERELAETKNKSRKDELARQITQEKQQLAYLHDEVEGAFTKARGLEHETSVLRGEHALTRYLTVGEKHTTATELSKEQVAGLGQRIAGADSRIASIPIDQRYDAMVTTNTADVEARSFNWGADPGMATADARSVATQAQQRDASRDAERANARTVATPTGDLAQGEVRSGAQDGTTTVRGNEDLANAGSAVGQLNTEVEGAEDQVSTTDPVNNGANDGATERAVDATAMQSGTGTTERTENASSVEPVSSERSIGAYGQDRSGTDVVASAAIPKNASTDQDRTEPVGSTAEEQEGPSVSQPSEVSAPRAAEEQRELDAFLLENQKAELQQALAAQRKSEIRDSLQQMIDQVDARLQANNATATTSRDETGTADDYSMEDVDMDRMPATFYAETKDEDIITMVFSDYESDKQRLQGLDEANARLQGLSGLELMLADSLRGELVRQAAVLELAPERGEQILPKMERLRVMRQDHLNRAETLKREGEEVILSRTAVGDDVRSEVVQRTRVNYALGEHPVNDRFIAVVPDAQEIYTSKVEHRSSKVDEAVSMKEADLVRMQVLDEQIDALEDSMVGKPRKDYDKLRKSTDKLIDERMIIRAELGQRSAFLMKEEWRTANDSLKRVDKTMATKGLAPDENLLMMAQGMQTEARALFTKAEGLRKQADRSEDILLRDSLFRTAYGSELEALAQIDRAITVKTYLISDEFQRGETLAYETIARRVLGIDEPQLAQATPAGTSITTTAASEGSDARVEVEPAVSIATRAESEEPASNVEPSTAVAATVGENSDATTTVAERTEPNEVPSTVVGEVASSTAAAGDTERARMEAREFANRTEAQLPVDALKPIKRYEDYLKGENIVLRQEGLDPNNDPQLLAIKAERAAATSSELEQRSLELADQATAIEDSMTTARKRDREELEQLAARTRIESDSLHEASLRLAEEARATELEKRDAEQAKVLRDRLVKYYYLTGEEQAMVVGNEDESRYFQAKARALEQYDAAADAEGSARINRELSTVLANEIATVKRDQAAGRLTPDEAQAKNEVLTARADQLAARADSLTNVAARLRGAAGINENQAAVMLQGLPADRSSETMALEMRTRRTEALLAETRDQAGPGAAVPNASSGNVASALPASDASSNSGATASARPTRAITAPFGTDGRAAAERAARPIAEVPELFDGSAFPEQLVNDIFALRPTAERAATPIPMDVRMPSGLVFKVQIGAFRKPIPEEAFSDMTPVMGEHTSNGLVRYTAGLFTGFDQAAGAKDKVRDRGYRDAFVVAYRDGVRIPLAEAMRQSRAAANSSEVLAVATPVQVASGSQSNASSTGNGNVTPSIATNVSTEPVTAPRTEGNSVLEPRPTSISATSGVQPAVIQAPLSTAATTTPATTTSTNVLDKYPASAEAIVAQFVPQPEATAYYNVPGAAPADQVELIRGLFYTVQVGVYSKPVALDKLFNIVPLNSERTETAKIRYTTGRYGDTEQARIRKDQAVASGVKDAFITAYLNGKRIPMQEAAALLERFGADILAKP